MSSDVEDIVRTAKDGDVSVFIFHSNVASDVTAREILPVTLVAGGITPDGAQHTWERALEDEATANVRRNGFTIFVNHVGLCTGNGDADFAGTHRHRRRSAERGAT